MQEKNYTETFFFDSYAIFEIMKGNKNYEKYTKTLIRTTKLNLFELYHGFLKDSENEKAETSLEEYYKFCIDFDRQTIKEAAELKIKLNKRNVSMADCLGYTLAKQLGIKFLTGDKEFENLDNVEFVK